MSRAVAGAMGLKSHQEERVHVEHDGAQGMQVAVHPSGDQYHVELQVVQNPLFPFRFKWRDRRKTRVGF